MIQLFQRLYGTRVAPNIIKYNDFTDIGAYYLLKACISPYVIVVIGSRKGGQGYKAAAPPYLRLPHRM